MFEVSSAKQKAGKEEPPSQASMRASSNEKIRRNPSTDQRKVRRMLNKKAAYKAIVEPDVNRDEWHAWTSPDGWATAFYLPDGSRVVVKGRADADQFQADNPEAELASSTHNPGRYSSVAKVAWSIADARQILDSGSYKKVDGMLLDHFSASALVQIFDALSPENQAKLEAMSLDKAMDIVWKLAAKHGSVRTTAKTAGYPDEGGYYPRDEPEATPEILAEMAAIKRKIQSWREGGDEDALGEAIQHYNWLADEYTLPRYGYDKPHYATLRTAGRPGDEKFDEYEKDDWSPQDGEPKYPELAEDDDDLFYDDFAHEASVSPFAIIDPTDTRPLHTRVAAAFLKG